MTPTVSSTPADWSRVMLGAALMIKGAAWEVAPVSLRLGLALCGVLVVLGRRSRIGTGFAAAIGWVVLVSDLNYSNHLYLLTILCTLATIPGPSRPESAAAVRTLAMAQVSIVYFWAGVWKVNTAFLDGSVLTLEWSRAWLLGPLEVSPSLVEVIAVLAVVAEITLAGILWSRRLVVPWALSLGVVLHLVMILSVGHSPTVTAELVVFALSCGSTYPLFAQRRHQHPSPAALV